MSPASAPALSPVLAAQEAQQSRGELRRSAGVHQVAGFDGDHLPVAKVTNKIRDLLLRHRAARASDDDEGGDLDRRNHVGPGWSEAVDLWAYLLSTTRQSKASTPSGFAGGRAGRGVSSPTSSRTRRPT